MFADNLWGMGALTRSDERVIEQLRLQLAGLWAHDALKNVTPATKTSKVEQSS
jgi:hypothetical protein